MMRLGIPWKKVRRPDDKRQVIELLVQENVSERQACKLVDLPRSSFRYKRKVKDDISLMEALEELIKKHPSIGFWKCYHRLRRKGHPWNHKRLYQVYKYG
ncbi:hypothetical protein U0033_17085 [Chitinophaga sancti]|uniref:Transposase n=1 Tax=Chitinophaga sancti TaxID=1004 RepID=A0ABZ0XD94_9BACT|nr:IS3 family transposase [Chitinophaga sancti]WQD59604.1 hypothetical protein U0033_17085 [Chitinophaga sancti]WQG88263.1 hypothetical protein SR876_25380 [Chitinophaga sancti]